MQELQASKWPFPASTRLPRTRWNAPISKWIFKPCIAKAPKKCRSVCVEHEATSESSRFQYHLYQEAVGDVTVGHPSVILLRNNKFQSSLNFPHLSSLPVTRKTVVSRLQRAKQATMKESHHKHPLSQASTKKPCDTKFIQIDFTPALRGLRGLPTTQKNNSR